MSIKRKFAYNLLGSVIPLAVSLVTTPIYLKMIGEARYGVLAIAWLLLGYFGLFDLGLGRATAQRMATLKNASVAERAQTFWTALTLNVGLGTIGALLIWPVTAYFFGNVFNVDDTLRPEIQAAVPWLVLAVPIATLSGVLGGALQGRERFFELNLISVLGTVFFQLLPLASALIFGANLGIILPSALTARLFTLIMLFERCWHHVFAGYAATFARAEAGQLLRFGGWVTVTSFVSPIMVILDRFIIGAISSAKAVSYYTIPFQLGQRTTIISTSLTAVLFPRFAAVSRLEQQHLALEGLSALVVVMTPLVAAGILLMEPFLAWWIAPEFAQQSATVGQVILLGFWVNNFATIPSAQLQACGRPDLVAKCHLVELLPYLGLLYLGLNILGLVGAAIAFTIRVAVDFILLSWLAGTLQRTLRGLLTPTLLLGLAYLIAMQRQQFKHVWFAIVVTHLLITLIWAWRHAPNSVRELVFVKFKPFSNFFNKRQI